MKNYKRDEDTVLRKEVMEIKKQNVVRRDVVGSTERYGVQRAVLQVFRMFHSVPNRTVK
jgi:hypothetical protein